MIEDFEKFIEASKNYYRNYKKIDEIKKEIKSIVKGFELSIWKDYIIEARKLDKNDLNTLDLKKLQDILGCPFDFGGQRVAKFQIEEDSSKGIPIVREYKRLRLEQKKLANTIVEMSGTQYPSAKICGKRRNLETFTHSCWGFRIREIDRELSLEDIIDIEKATGSKFIERNTYGCDFKFSI